MLLINSNVSNFTQNLNEFNLNEFFGWPNLMKAVGITT